MGGSSIKEANSEIANSGETIALFLPIRYSLFAIPYWLFAKHHSRSFKKRISRGAMKPE